MSITAAKETAERKGETADRKDVALKQAAERDRRQQSALKASEFLAQHKDGIKGMDKNPVVAEWEKMPILLPTCRIVCRPTCEKCAGFGNRLALFNLNPQ